MSWIRRANAETLAAWKTTKVELQGWLSPNRLNNLHAYTEKRSTWRVLLVCLLSPLPCLAVILPINAIPLEPPEAGVGANYAAMIRALIVTWLIDFTVVLMIGESVPQLGMRLSQAILIGVLAGTSSIALVTALAWTTVFPFPFSVLVAAPPGVTVIIAGFAYFWGHRLRTDEALRHALMGQISILACQVTLTAIYPLFIAAFERLGTNEQMFFVILLPIIKSIAKNWISRALDDQHDAKPEAVIVTIEVFHGLYVSTAMQTALSVRTALVLTTLDILQGVSNVHSIASTLRDVRELMRKIPREHPLANQSVLQIAVQLAGEKEKQESPGEANSDVAAAKTAKRSSIFPDTLPGLEILREELDYAEQLLRHASGAARDTDSRTRSSFSAIAKFLGAKVAPVNLPGPTSSDVAARTKSTLDTQDLHLREATQTAIVAVDTKPFSMTLRDIFSADEREMFVDRTARALFTNEYVMLVEYTEVVVPIIYSIYLLAMFHMPNCAYYPSLDILDEAQQVATITNVLIYAAVELALLIFTSLALQRVLGVSPFRQLAFVLDTQKTLVQAKLTLWILYILQIPLAHLGVDFTFQFKWLKKSN